MILFVLLHRLRRDRMCIRIGETLHPRFFQNPPVIRIRFRQQRPDLRFHVPNHVRPVRIRILIQRKLNFF